MPEKSAIGIPEKITLPIPGTKKKIKIPRWALFAAAGVAVVAVLLLRGKRAEEAEPGALALGPGEVAPAPEPEPEPLIEPTPIPDYWTPAPEYAPVPSGIPTVTFVPGEGQVPTGFQSAITEGMAETEALAVTKSELTRIFSRQAKVPAEERITGAGEIRPDIPRGAAPTTTPSVIPSGPALEDRPAVGRWFKAFQENVRLTLDPLLPLHFPHALPEEEREREELMEILRRPITVVARYFPHYAPSPTRGRMTGGRALYAPTPAPSPTKTAAPTSRVTSTIVVPSPTKLPAPTKRTATK